MENRAIKITAIKKVTANGKYQYHITILDNSTYLHTPLCREIFSYSYLILTQHSLNTLCILNENTCSLLSLLYDSIYNILILAFYTTEITVQKALAKSGQ